MNAYDELYRKYENIEYIDNINKDDYRILKNMVGVIKVDNNIALE